MTTTAAATSEALTGFAPAPEVCLVPSLVTAPAAPHAAAHAPRHPKRKDRTDKDHYETPPGTSAWRPRQRFALPPARRAITVDWVNDFLDNLRLRQFSLRSPSSYGYDLLHFAGWWLAAASRGLADLNASLLRDYVRSQLDQQPQPAGQTINHRLDVVRCLYRFHYDAGLDSSP